jgi:enoyl-CoA hydratase/carnithine racemase
VAIVTGAGDKAFCAGADLKALAAGRLEEIVDVAPGGFAGLVRGDRRKPVIAAVNGAALAGGLEILLACDVVIAAEHARFGLPEVSRGIIAGAGGLQRLPLLIPPLRALELLLTARLFDAQEAFSLGLVAEVVPPELVLPRAFETAHAICANAPVAVRETRAVVRGALAEREQSAWARTEQAWASVLESPEALEGMRAFAEKRPPTWAGA